MTSKAVSLFLSLSLAATLAACGGTDQGGEGGEGAEMMSPSPALSSTPTSSPSPTPTSSP
jgi:hypothetical protein